MSISIPEVAEKVHSLLAGQGVPVHMYSPTGESVSDARDATRFVVHKPNLVIRINQDDDSLNLMCAEDMYGETLHEQLRNLARDYLLSFDYRLFDKTLKARGEKLDAKRAQEQEEMENIEESKLSYDDFVGVGQHMWDCTYELKGRHAGVTRHTGVQTKEKNEADAKALVKKRHPNADPSSITCKYKGVRTEESNDEALEESYAVSFDRENKTLTMIQQHWRQIPREYKRVQDGKRSAWPGALSAGYTDVPKDEFWTVHLYGRSRAGQGDVEARRGDRPDTLGQIFGATDEALAEAKGFGRPTGTSRTSYQKLDDSISIVVRHKKRIAEEDEVRPGVRSRNIESVYIRRGGERFRMAENYLPSARAMARHMQNGGEVWDAIGESINRAAGDMNRLNRFVRYVDRNGLINEHNGEYVQLAREQLNSIRGVIESMGGQRGYARNSQRIVDLMSAAPEALDEDLESLFVEKRKDDRVVTAMEDLKGLVAKRRQFQRSIDEAVENEKFDSLKDLLGESDMYDFADAKARLSHQVSQMGSAAQDPTLGSYLTDISSKISSGGQLSQHEYGTIKRCLMNANGSTVSESREVGKTSRPFSEASAADDQSLEGDKADSPLLADIKRKVYASVVRAFNRNDKVKDVRTRASSGSVTGRVNKKYAEQVASDVSASLTKTLGFSVEIELDSRLGADHKWLINDEVFFSPKLSVSNIYGGSDVDLHFYALVWPKEDVRSDSVAKATKVTMSW